MKTIEEVKEYLQRKMKQYDDLCNMYIELYKNALDKKSKKTYKSLLDSYNASWIALAMAIQDIEG